jgi:hypothetical protein
MLDERRKAFPHDLEGRPLQDQQHFAAQIEIWDLTWQRLLKDEGPTALYQAALDEIRRGERRPLRL